MIILSLLLPKLAGLFALALLGVLLRRKEVFHEAEFKGLARLVIDVTMPALFFIEFSALSGMPAGAGMALAWGGLIGFVAASLAWTFIKLKNIDNKGTFLFACAIGNSAFLPLPLCQALWGQEGLDLCLYFILGNNIFLFTFGLWFYKLEGKGKETPSVVRLLLHPQTLAFALGALWHWSGWILPSWAVQTCQGLGQSTIPLAMLATGGLLAGPGRKIIENKGFFVFSGLIKLFLLPLAALVALKSLGIAGVLAGVLLLQAAMPSLASASAYASRFGGDVELAGGASFWTSLACLATLPAFLALGQGLGLF